MVARLAVAWLSNPATVSNPESIEQRRAIAKRIGLGQSRKKTVITEPAAETIAVTTPKRRKLSLSLKG